MREDDKMILKNFKPYEPVEKIYGEDVIYLQDESGADWYESQKEFKADTMKAVYDKNGVIVSCSRDISALYPLDCSVIEVDTDKADLLGLYVINENVIFEPKPSNAHEWHGKGWIISAENQTALLTEKRDTLIEQIDSHAATIYSQWTRFESEYRERQAAAEAYKSANYQGECSRYITDFAKRAGIDNKTATDLILVQAAGLEKLQVELANQRMRKYELKVPGLTLEQMQATYDDIIKQMDSLMEAYKNG